MLALVGALAFALLSMAALTTDLGLAAAEQSRLETAAANFNNELLVVAFVLVGIALGEISQSLLECDT